MMNSRPTKRPDSQHGPFRGLRRGMNNLIANKVFLAVFSFVVAVLFWSVLVASDGTLTREKVFQNVSVGVTGEAPLKSRGYIVTDNIREMLPGVKVTAEVRQSNYENNNATSYNLHIDLTDVKGEGINELPVSYSNTVYGEVKSCEPSSIKVNVERYITRRIPVSIVQEGTLAEGIFVDTTRSDPTMLSVSGPQSLVTQVVRAVARLDLSVLTLERASDKMALQITLQNSKGETIESDKLEVTNQTVITDSIVAEVELLPLRSVPLDLEAFVTGKPAPGYELEGVYAETTALDVSAKPETLENITLLTTDQPINIEGATQSVSGYVRLKKPTGIENVVPTDIAVTARICEETVERTFRSVPVYAEGVSADQRVTLMTENMRVQLSGGYAFINGLEKDDIRLFVDVTGLEPGLYMAPVQIHIDNAETFSCALGSPEIQIRIREKEIK